MDGACDKLGWKERRVRSFGRKVEERNCLAGIGMNEKVLGWMLVGGCEMDPSG
jgi:hypothetical protein